MTEPTTLSTLLAKRIRHRMRDDPPDGTSAFQPSVRALTDDLETLHKTWDLRFFDDGSARAGLGTLVNLVRRFLRLALFPLVSRQSEFNAASMGLLVSLFARISDLETEAASLRRQLAAATDRPSGFDLLQLAERFGDTELEVIERQRGYVAHFVGQAPVVDLGCGRGEFLELLRDAEIESYGVDGDPSMVSRARAKRLRIRHEDVLDHLASLDDGTLGGVFAAQVVEHLDARGVASLARLSAAKLRPGGVVVLETINPRVVRGLQRFYVDFTRVRPYDPEAIAWLLEQQGFREVSIEYSLESPELAVPRLGAAGLDASAFDDAMARVNDMLYGPTAFAVVATKPD